MRRTRNLIRTAGRTAVVAGTATAVSGRVANRQQQKFARQEAARNAAAPAQNWGPAPSPGDDLVGKLQQLADLRETGALSEKEFAAAKARLLQS
jgi:hypothetical protein